MLVIRWFFIKIYLQTQYCLELHIPRLTDRYGRTGLKYAEVTVFLIRIDTRDLLYVEDIAAMCPHKLGRVQHLLKIIHRLVLQECAVVRMYLYIIV